MKISWGIRKWLFSSKGPIVFKISYLSIRNWDYVHRMPLWFENGTKSLRKGLLFTRCQHENHLKTVRNEIGTLIGMKIEMKTELYPASCEHLSIRNRIMTVPGQWCRFKVIPASCERGLRKFSAGEIQPIDVIITRLNSLFTLTNTSECWGKCCDTWDRMTINS